MEVEEGLPPLQVDRVRIETVIRNLVENAVKYAGPEASIRIQAQRSGEHVIFRVSDDGPGIPPEERERIFESFYRVESGLTRTASGAGLGLAICHGLVRAHGGNIWVESPAKGACIAFSIPIIPQAVEEHA
jgi:two-component system sensor histidine kinase KdpD